MSLLRHPFSTSVLAGMVAATCIVSNANAGQIFLTDFTKNNNIYTSLNQEFPNTGPGVPGSGVGTPNSSVLFNPAAYTSPSYVAGSNQTTNGVTFQLTSDSAGRDYAQIDSGLTLNIPVNAGNILSFSLLASAYNGQSANFIITAADGSTQVFSNVFLPDFNGGGSVNDTTNGVTRQTALQVRNTGAGGTGNSSNGAFNTYNLTEVSFALSPSLANQQITSIGVQSNGFEPLILAATAVTGDPTSVPEPATLLLVTAAVAGVIATRRRS